MLKTSCVCLPKFTYKLKLQVYFSSPSTLVHSLHNVISQTTAVYSSFSVTLVTSMVTLLHVLVTAYMTCVQRPS